MKKYLVEFIGSFFLVMTYICTMLGSAESVLMAPIATGAVLMVMIFAGEHISGAHYNPAVSIAVLMRGRMDSRDLIPYVAAQMFGALAASLVSSNVFDLTGVPVLLDIGSVVTAEVLGTFALAYVVLNVTTAKTTSGNSYFGLAIGFTFTAMSFSLGNVSVGAFNPAIAMGITLSGMEIWSNIWIYFLGSLAGGALAAIVFGYTYGKED